MIRTKLAHKRSAALRDRRQREESPMEDTENLTKTIPSSPVPEAEGSDAGGGADSLTSERRQSTRRRRPSRKGKKRPEAIDAGAVPEPAPVTDDSWDPRQFKVPAAPGKTRFQDFDLPAPLLHTISDLGFQYCTPSKRKSSPAPSPARMPAAGRKPAPARPPPFSSPSLPG